MTVHAASRLAVVLATGSVLQSCGHGRALIVDIEHPCVGAKQFTGSSNKGDDSARRHRKQHLASHIRLRVRRWQDALFTSTHVFLVLSTATYQVVQHDVPANGNIERDQSFTLPVCLVSLFMMPDGTATQSFSLTRDERESEWSPLKNELADGTLTVDFGSRYFEWCASPAIGFL